MRQILKTRTFRIVTAVAVAICLYAVAGFVVAPRLVRSALLEDIPKSIGATPTVGAIHINPFLWRASVEDLSLAGARGEKLLGFKRLFVDFELSSLWHRAYSFGNIDLTDPYVTAVTARDGSLNLSQLRPRTTAHKPATNSETLPAVRIGSLKVSQGLVSYEDRSQPDEFAARLEPINFELRDFSTGVAGGKFTFTAASKLGERFEWHGHLSVDPIESDGEFRITDLRVQTLWDYFQDRLNFVVDSGTFGVEATYRFSLADPAAEKFHVDVSKVSLADLTVRPKTSPAAPAASGAPRASGATAESSAPPWITVPSLEVTGTAVDVTKRQVQVGLVAATGVKLSTWLAADGTFNLTQLASAPVIPAKAQSSAPSGGAAAAAAPTLSATPGAAAVASAPWAVDVRRLAVREASIAVEDRSAQPAVKLLLAPLSLQVDGASLDLGKPVTVALDTHLNTAGTLSATGEVTFKPLAANLNVKLAAVDLTVLQPYISQHTAMTLLSGTVGGTGKLHYGVQPRMPTVQFVGDVVVGQVHSVDDTLHDDFIDWDRVNVLGLTYTQAPDRLDIERIEAHKLYARVILESDESMNVKRVLKIPPSVAVPVTAEAAARAAGEAPAGVEAPKAKPTAKIAQAAAPTLPIAIKKIVLEDSQANFADLSVKPNFAAGINKLGGTVVGLSSAPGSRAHVDLKGSVDTFSPVTIVGDVNVLGPLYTDLTMSFQNISLPVLDPYSGKFAGYSISKGKLSTEFHYKVNGRKLDAQHHILIEQLEFGDKTPSKDAVSLPIKLAVALLKDRNGVIDLNIPVTGSLDDPTFRLAPIIWKVFTNILERAATAPFALLGSLFGGGPDIQFIGFPPGVATLDAQALEKVQTVAKALTERPQLKIEIPIAELPDVDGPALLAAQFDAQIAAAQSAAGGAKKPAAGPPSRFDQLDPATQLDVLARAYATVVGGEPKYPDAVTSLKAKPDVVAAKIDFLNKAVHGHLTLGDGALQQLGQQRALAVQAGLLTDTPVAAERVFLAANDKASVTDGRVRLELTLQ